MLEEKAALDTVPAGITTSSQGDPHWGFGHIFYIEPLSAYFAVFQL